MYANILIEYPVKSLDKTFTYEVPDEYIDVIKVGMKVKVPFNNKELNGIVLDLTNDKPLYEIKKIIDINKDIYLNDELLSLGKFISAETLCPLISAYETMLPPALKINKDRNNYDLFETYIYLNEDEDFVQSYIDSKKNIDKQIEIIDLLKGGPILKKELSSSVNTLLKYNVVYEKKEKKNRINTINEIEDSIPLNEEQEVAYNTIKASFDKYNAFLLEGVTGSGKTEVYMHLISDVISKGKSVIVLVPEISLTTQAIERFYKRFGENVAIFHSGLSIGEKYDEYLKIYEGKVSIVVGTRSSIFVPLKNLGLIVIDEEHSDSYKQDTTPRYDAKDVAIFRCKYHNVPLVLASATPTLESKARTMKDVYHLVTLTKRAKGSMLPKTYLVDMGREVIKKNFIFSEMLKDKIREKLDKHEQIILLLNRRGYSTFITCNRCGFTYKCPNCDITLTYHKEDNILKCHYCDYTKDLDNLCPECNNKSLSFLGLGTQRLEDETRKLFPDASIIRMDQDTTSKKGSLKNILDEFSSHKYDILLGTQMISKGLDFKDVTLVGIINADTSLNIPDFRANEKTFDLLYQTSGRSGRDTKEGEVIIQTYNPDNRVLSYVKDNDYEGFYKYEMNIRHNLFYPPYSYITTVNIKSYDEGLALNEANKIHDILKNKISDKTLVYDVTPSYMHKINNIYSYQILIKYTFDDKLKSILKDIDNTYILNNKVNVEITFNPSKF